jgi:hypothetical protein
MTIRVSQKCRTTVFDMFLHFSKMHLVNLRRSTKPIFQKEQASLTKGLMALSLRPFRAMKFASQQSLTDFACKRLLIVYAECESPSLEYLNTLLFGLKRPRRIPFLVDIATFKLPVELSLMIVSCTIYGAMASSRPRARNRARTLLL